MSRIGNMPVAVPDGVDVKIEGQHITVKGPKGSLERDIHPNITGCSPPWAMFAPMPASGAVLIDDGAPNVPA